MGFSGQVKRCWVRDTSSYDARLGQRITELGPGLVTKKVVTDPFDDTLGQGGLMEELGEGLEVHGVKYT